MVIKGELFSPEGVGAVPVCQTVSSWLRKVRKLVANFTCLEYGFMCRFPGSVNIHGFIEWIVLEGTF